MKKPESKKKFIASVIFMIALVVGYILLARGFALMESNRYIANILLYIGGGLIGVSFIVLINGTGDLFKTFFTTIFGKDKPKE